MMINIAYYMTSGSDKTPCYQIDKQLVVYRFRNSRINAHYHDYNAALKMATS